MKTILLAVVALGLANSAWAEECSFKKNLKEAQTQVNRYSPPKPKQKGASLFQSGDMENHAENTDVAKRAALTCVTDYRAFADDFKKLQDEIKQNPNPDEDCSRVTKIAKQEEKKANGKADDCQKTANALAGQSSTSQANADKMENTDKKEEEKKGGGEGGGGGQPPQPPQKPEDQGQSAAECKKIAKENLSTRQANCRAQFPFDPAHAVADMKKKQDDCLAQATTLLASETGQCK